MDTEPRGKGFEGKKIQVRRRQPVRTPSTPTTTPHHGHAGLTWQHKPPHQHHVPGVLAHVSWWLQRLQHGRGSGLFEQKPQGRQLPRRHNGEVDPPLQGTE